MLARTWWWDAQPACRLPSGTTSRGSMCLVRIAVGLTTPGVKVTLPRFGCWRVARTGGLKQVGSGRQGWEGIAASALLRSLLQGGCAAALQTRQAPHRLCDPVTWVFGPPPSRLDDILGEWVSGMNARLRPVATSPSSLCCGRCHGCAHTCFESLAGFVAPRSACVRLVRHE